MSKRRAIKVEVDGITIAVLKTLLHQVEQQQKIRRQPQGRAENSTLFDNRQLSFTDQDSEASQPGEEP